MCAALFAMHMPLLMEALGLAEAKHNAKNHRTANRAIVTRPALRDKRLEGSARREGGK